MSDWNPVTSKKKSLPVERPPLPPPTFFQEVSPGTNHTTRLRAEFSLQSGSKKFNPAVALRDLFLAIKRDYDSATFYNVDSTHQVLLAENFHLSGAQFETHFLVQPHLGRNGGGRIHLHFRVSEALTIASVTKSYTLLNYLQRNRIWLAEHKFQDTAIASAGFIFLKSPAMTHQVEYIHSLRHHLHKELTVCDYSK